MISENVKYVGVNDYDLDLFESQYEVPNGMAYNSYIILDDKIAIMDTVDHRATGEWLSNVKKELGDRKPDYLVISHMEPDHSASIGALVSEYPGVTLVGSAKALQFLDQFYDNGIKAERITAAEGFELKLGSHTLTFYAAAMVHWPEVLVSYESSEKLLFAADAFGSFGTLDQQEDDWACEARRYYFNIVGKYGAQVQALLKKLSGLDVAKILPLHGPVLMDNLEFYLGKYNTWSSYLPEDSGVAIVCGSIHGNTLAAAVELRDAIEERGVKASLFDLSRDDVAEAVEDAFRYDRLVIASATYDGGLFLPTLNFVNTLISKGYQNRLVGILENGTWAPMAAKKVRELMEGLKSITFADTVVTVKSALSAESRAQIGALADELCK